MDIATGIAATKSGIEVVKTIATLLKQQDLPIDRVEIANRILLVCDQLLDSRTALTDAKDEIDKLKVELAQENRLAELAADLDMQLDGRFFVRKSEASKGLIPYCPICWGNNEKLVPLTRGHSPGLFDCRLGHGSFETKAYRVHQNKLYSGQMTPEDEEDAWKSM